MDLSGKHILLTGAAGGIGRAIALAASQAGARLVLCERDNALAAQACEGVAGAIALSADISDEAQVESMLADTVRELGGLDGIVNNAATLAMNDGGINETPLDAWNKTLRVNLTGVFLMCKYALPHLRATGGGSIVNMSSVVAHRGSAVAQVAYTASKGGVEALTREIAIAHARDNIRANCVACGPVKTERNAHYFDTLEKWQMRRRHIPLGRLGTPEEIAATVCFLLSDSAAFQTGSTVHADGGIAAAYLIDDHDGQKTP